MAHDRVRTLNEIRNGRSPLFIDPIGVTRKLEERGDKLEGLLTDIKRLLEVQVARQLVIIELLEGSPESE